MAFTSTRTWHSVFGNKRVAFGTYLSDGGSTGGDINTGLKACEAIFFAASGAAAVADDPSVNETLPVAGNAVTIVTTQDKGGYWLALGY